LKLKLYLAFTARTSPPSTDEIAKKSPTRFRGADGIVIAHGTDQCYTAAALIFALQNLPVPVIVVGAQRSRQTKLGCSYKPIEQSTPPQMRLSAEVALAMHESTSDTAISSIEEPESGMSHKPERHVQTGDALL